MKIIKLLEIIDEKKYIVYLEDNNIKFGYLDNDQIINDLSYEEKNKIITIYNYLVGQKNDQIKLSSTKIFDSLITFFYNPVNRLYSFLEVKDNKYTIPNNDIVCYLNILLNNQDSKLYIKENSKKNKRFKIVIRTASGLVTVYILSSLLLSYLPNMPQSKLTFKIDYAIDNMYKDANTIQDNKDYSFDSIKKIINDNYNLTEEEKEFLYNIEDEVTENIDYINLEQLKNNLKELKINYNSPETIDQQNQVFNNCYISGSYTYMGSKRNNIDIYADNFNIATDFSNANKTTLIHEINHLISNRPNIIYTGGLAGDIESKITNNLNLYNNALSEMVNELFAREYAIDYNLESESNGYDGLMPVMYALAEIIDTDVLRKYKFDSDDYYITNYLKSIGIDDKYIYTFYKDLNLIKENSIDSTEKSYIYQEIYNIVGLMYQKKYDETIENDLVMMAYFYNTPYSNKGLDSILESEVNSNDIIKIAPKGYFSKKYIEKHPDVEVYVYSENKESVFTLYDKIDNCDRAISFKK